MKFIYTNEKENIEVELERWAWGVVYKPTKEQIEEAEKATVSMREELVRERNQVLNKERKNGADKEALKQITDDYENRINQICNPKQDELKQFTDDGKFHRFAEIEQDRIDIFTMFRVDDPTMTKRIDIEVQPGMQIFHFYRNLVLNYEHKEKTRRIKVYVFGWKDENGMSYNYILPDDRVVSSNRDIRSLLKYNI